MKIIGDVCSRIFYCLGEYSTGTRRTKLHSSLPAQCGGYALSSKVAEPALVLPLQEAPSKNAEITEVLVVLHAYYTEIAKDIIHQLASLDPKFSHVRFRLVVTTDSSSKAHDLGKVVETIPLGRFSGTTFRVFENRGRNVAPLLAVLNDWQGNESWILHLHTKKSLHARSLRGWGEYLVNALIGSNEVVRSIADLLVNSRVGLIYPAHFREIVDLRQWGPNLTAGEALLNRMGVSAEADAELDFPTGFMFWVRRQAILPLLALRLKPDDFEEELGQLDGTLAHAIERVASYAVISSGYTVAAVVNRQRRHAYYGRAVTMSLEQARESLNGTRRSITRQKRFTCD